MAKNFIVIPTYNEVKNISVILDKVLSLYPETNIFVVDDNSPDGTAAVIVDYCARYPNIELYSRPGKLGLASAYIEAFKKILALHGDARSVITMDADFAHDPAVVRKMLRLMDEYDVVIGSRYVSGGSIGYWPLWRRILSRSGNFYARVVTGAPFRDMTSGFHCFRADLLRKYDMDAIHSAGFAFLMEMKIIANELGARAIEIPIILGDRKEGKSKLSKHIIYEGLIVPWIFFLKKHLSRRMPWFKI